jgi:hypothetical protein
MVMVYVRLCRNWSVSRSLLGLVVLLVSPVSADDDPQAKHRLKLMEEEVGSLEAVSAELKTKPALTFASKPLLRYSDPTRGIIGSTDNVLLDGSVWRMGTEGRPTALVTIELYGKSSAPSRLTYEFLTLTKTRFSLKHKEGLIPRWEPTESGLTLKELPEAPKPAVTTAARLVQMRQLARRFTVKEKIRGKEIECRLLTQPIDRYQSEVDKIVDGAIFVHVNSTNPEMGVVIETDGNRWVYGTLRLSGAESTVALDGREVAAYRSGTSGSYQYGVHEIIDTVK